MQRHLGLQPVLTGEALLSQTSLDLYPGVSQDAIHSSIDVHTKPWQFCRGILGWCSASSVLPWVRGVAATSSFLIVLYSTAQEVIACSTDPSRSESISLQPRTLHNPDNACGPEEG